MTPLNLDQLLRVAEEAAGGSWEQGRMTPCRVVTPCGDFSVSWSSNDGERDRLAEATALHIATFDPPTVKALIEQNRALVEAVKALMDASPPLIVKAVREPEDADCLIGWAEAALNARILLTTIEANHAG